MNSRRSLCLLAALLIAACEKEATAPAPVADAPNVVSTAGPVVIYDTRGAAFARELLEAYRAETGKRYVLVPDGAAVHGAEGSLPKADLYLVQGLAGLWRLAENDAFRPVFSTSIENNIPPLLRDTESRWTGLSVRGQFVVYNTEQVAASDLANVTGYDSLGGAPWRGRLCLASAKNSGNRALVALLIKGRGVRSAEIVVREWIANLALSPFSGDTELLEAIADGRCAIGIAGSNAMFEFVTRNPSAAVEVHFFAKPESMLVDVSGAGVSRHATDPDGATALLEWLTTSSPNALHAAVGRDAPANPRAPVTAEGRWYESAAYEQSMSELGFLLEDADKLVERARYQ